MANYYEILQVPRDATKGEIKSAFRRLALRYHPDVNRDDPDAAAKFREIENAYEVLRDRARRQRYDRETNPAAIPDIPPDKREAVVFYQTGLRYARERDFQRAIEYYGKAIETDPNLWTAHLKRAEANYQSYRERLVFRDCQRVVELKPDCGEAYYYLGLARQRLGYTQSAIDAYNRAIALDPDPKAYYQRGTAREELSEYTAASEDWRKAAEGFRRTGDHGRYRLLQRKIATLPKNASKRRGKRGIELLKTLPGSLASLLKTLLTSLVDPRGGLTATFVKTRADRALVMGAIAGALGGGCLAFSWQNWSVIQPIERLWGLGILPFLIVSLSSYLIRKLGNYYGRPGGDFFSGGFTFLPLAIVLAIVSRVSPDSGIGAFAIGMTIVHVTRIGYGAYTGISNIPPRIALFYVPLVMFFVGVVIWGVYYYL